MEDPQPTHHSIPPSDTENTTPTRVPSPSPTLTGPDPASAKKVYALQDEQFLAGTGSREDPFVVGWAENDVADPYTWSKFFK